jgi:hypothetical protein
MQKALYLTGLISLTLLLNACQLFQNSADNQKARCKEMKNQMMFSGQSANQNIAFTERSEQDKLAQSYHDEGCT